MSPIARIVSSLALSTAVALAGCADNPSPAATATAPAKDEAPAPKAAPLSSKPKAGGKAPKVIPRSEGRR